MKYIYLTQGQQAIVDDEDYKALNKYNWCAMWNKGTQSFYAVRNAPKPGGGQYLILMHRHILGLEKGNKHQGDHKNHNTLDNRRKNLRAVTQNKNQANRRAPKGYSYDIYNKKYHAQITVDKKPIFLGLFDTSKEAHDAYVYAKKKYHKIDLINGTFLDE